MAYSNFDSINKKRGVLYEIRQLWFLKEKNVWRL